MTRPLLYLAHPVRDATDAELDATNAARMDAWARGWTPVASLVVLMGLVTEAEREAIISASCALARKCDAMLIVGKRVTEGMRAELEAFWSTCGPVYAGIPAVVPGSLDDDWLDEWLHRQMLESLRAAPHGASPESCIARVES